jgi:quinol monooxygenase YgiN
MIAAAVRLVAQPGKRDELLRRVREEMFQPTRREAGCIQYRFYQDVEDPNAFSFVEEWRDHGCLDEHFRSKHVGRFLEAVGDLVSEPPEARFYDVTEVRGLEAIEEARAST